MNIHTNTIQSSHMNQFQHKPLTLQQQHEQRNKNLLTYGVIGIGSIIAAAIAYIVYKHKLQTDVHRFGSSMNDNIDETNKSPDVISPVKSAVTRINADEHKKLAKQYYDNKQYNNAINSYKEAIQYEPNKHTLHTNLANALYDIKQYSESIKYSDSSIAIKSTANALYTKGRSYIGLKQYEQAIQYLTQAEVYDDYNKVKHLIQQEIKKANNYLRRTTRVPDSSNNNINTANDTDDVDSDNNNINQSLTTDSDNTPSSNTDSGIFNGHDTVQLNHQGMSQSELNISNNNNTSDASPVELPSAGTNYDVNEHTIDSNKSFASLLRDVPDEMKAMPKQPITVISQADAEATTAPVINTNNQLAHTTHHNKNNHRGSHGKNETKKYVPVKKQ